MLIDHMSSGLSYECFAAIANCCDDTLREWEKNYPEFSAAKKEAFTKNRVFWEKIGIAGMSGKIKNFSAVMWIFNMKNRFRHEWNENFQHDISTMKDGNVKINVVLPKNNREKKENADS